MTRDAIDAASLVKRHVRSLSLGRDLDKAAQRKLTIRTDSQAILSSHIDALTAFFDRRFPWER